MKRRMENIENEQGNTRQGDISESEGEPIEPTETQVTSMTDAEIQALKAEAEKARHYYDQWARTTADLDNYKKRATRERQEAIKFANEALIEKLIPVLDNFDSALAATAQASQSTSAQSLQTGINMILQQLKSVLTEARLEEIDASNKTFDPNWHEALSQQPSAEVPEGQVLQQLRKGYKLRERLLRPAGVVVARKPTA